MGRMSQVKRGVVLDEDEDVVDYGDEVLGDEGDEAEIEEEEDEPTHYTKEDEENMSLFELVHATVASNPIARAVHKQSKKIFGSTKTVTSFGLKLGWVLVSSVVIWGVPIMLAAEGERAFVEGQNMMVRQGQGAPSGPP